MLSYKEYKLLNESLYGAFNLGLKNPNTVGGIVSASSINGTEAALEAEAEEAIEEAKKMKKKMDCGSDEEEMENPEDEKEDSKASDEGSEDEEEEDEEEDSEEDEDEEEEEPKFMKKKAKKEWMEVLADLETVLEGIDDEESASEIKKGMEILKEGLKKGLKGHKKGCDCKFCQNIKSKKESDDEGEGDEEGLTDAQKKLPEALRKAIAKKAKKGKGKDEKKCGKYMNEDEQAWWNSVNSMINTDAVQKNWDGGWSQVGEVQQAIREGAELRGGGLSRMNIMTGGDGKQHNVKPGETWASISKLHYGDEKYAKALYDFNWEYYKQAGENIGHMNSVNALRPGRVVFVPEKDFVDDDRLELEPRRENKPGFPYN